MLAHRGLVPVQEQSAIVENSFASIAAAQAAGAQYIETDCRMTADGTVVLFHDERLERVTGDVRPMSAITLHEFETMMAPRGGAVTLRQALDAFPTVRFNVDVKESTAAVAAGRTVAPFADRVLLTGFDDTTRLAALEAATAAGGRPATSPGRSVIMRILSALTLHRRGAVNRLLADIDALQIPERQGPVPVLTQRLLDAAHAADVEVHVWTVNDVDDMRRLVARGVDGIVTDRADLALRSF